MEEKIRGKNRVESIKKGFLKWLDDPYNKSFFIILIGAFLIRFWIFLKTYDQAIWWDAGTYLTTAKKIGLGLETRDVWYYRRGFFWAAYPALMFFLGLGEKGIRFSEVLFSTGIVWVSYLLIKDMFNKKLALLSSICLSLSWLLLFFTARPLTSIPATFLLITSVLFFWKGYVLKKGDKFLYLFAAFYALAILTRMQYVVVIPVYLIFIFTREKFGMFKNKKLWITAGIFCLMMIPQVILYWQHYGNPLTDMISYYGGIEGVSQTGETHHREWMNSFRYLLDLPYILSGAPTGEITSLIYLIPFIIFLIGIIFFFSELILGFDKIFKNKKLQKRFFILLWVLTIFITIGYASSDVIEQRYVIPGMTFVSLIIAQGIFSLGKFIKKYIPKKSYNLVLVGILILIFVPNLLWGISLIDAKKSSYVEVKDAGEWIRENSNVDDIVISASVPQIAYYSERDTYPFNIKEDAEHRQYTELFKYDYGEEGFIQFVEENEPRYLMLSIYESHPDWAYALPETYNNSITPVKIFPETGNQLMVIIYEFSYPLVRTEVSNVSVNETS